MDTLKKSTMFIRKSDADIKVLNVGLMSRLNGLAVGSTIKNRRVTPYVGDCADAVVMQLTLSAATIGPLFCNPK